uniref:Putative secreted protein n=1 Tax=Anopheles darlingi TaxID=43151 RepID=A0A2M4DGV2_ANODA
MVVGPLQPSSIIVLQWMRLPLTLADSKGGFVVALPVLVLSICCRSVMSVTRPPLSAHLESIETNRDLWKTIFPAKSCKICVNNAITYRREAQRKRDRCRLPVRRWHQCLKLYLPWCCLLDCGISSPFTIKKPSTRNRASNQYWKRYALYRTAMTRTVSSYPRPHTHIGRR